MGGTKPEAHFILYFSKSGLGRAVLLLEPAQHPEHEGVKELQAKLQAEMAEHTKTKEALKEQKISTDAEHKFLLIERGKRVEQAEKISSLEAEVHDRDMTIMELKAKLYDLMTAGEN